MPSGCMEPGCVCTLATLVDTGPLCPLQGVWAFWEETNTQMACWKSFYGTLAVLLLSPCTKEKITITLLGYGPPPGPSTSPGVSWYLFYIVDSGLKSVWGKIQISQEWPTEDKEKVFFLPVVCPICTKAGDVNSEAIYSAVCIHEKMYIYKNKKSLVSVSLRVTFPPTFTSLIFPNLNLLRVWDQGQSPA